MKSHALVRALGGATIALCLFGLFESVDAAIGVFGPPRGPFGALFDYPLWSLSHFVPGMLFMGLAPIQLWAMFRNRHRQWHRWSGRIVVASAVFLGFSGVAFVFLMPERPLNERVFMLTFFVAFLFFLLKGFLAARRRDFLHHRAWMIRMFSTGLTITTQRLLVPMFIAFAGVNGVQEFWDHFVTAAWLAWIIQLALAEWWIARGAAQPVVAARRPAAV